MDDKPARFIAYLARYLILYVRRLAIAVDPHTALIFKLRDI